MSLIVRLLVFHGPAVNNDLLQFLGISFKKQLADVIQWGTNEKVEPCS